MKKLEKKIEISAPSSKTITSLDNPSKSTIEELENIFKLHKDLQINKSQNYQPKDITHKTNLII